MSHETTTTTRTTLTPKQLISALNEAGYRFIPRDALVQVQEDGNLRFVWQKTERHNLIVDASRHEG